MAQAETDWVFVDSQTGNPVAIPLNLLAEFFPEGLPEMASPRSRFLTPSFPPLGVFRTQRKVQWRDLDSMLHVNNELRVRVARARQGTRNDSEISQARRP